MKSPLPRTLPLALLLSLSAPGAEDPARLSPFSGVRWEGTVPEVEVRSTWYRLAALDGLPAEEIVAFSRKTYGDRWGKRFEEDIVEVLSRMGHPPGNQVLLRLVTLDSGKTIELEGVPMTEENRRKIWRLARERDGSDVPSRVRRAHAEVVPEDLRFLTRRIEGARSRGSRRLSRADAEADLDELERHLETSFSYLTRRGVDHRAALDAVRSALGDGIDAGAFAIQIAKVLALFGDAHTRLDDDFAAILPAEYAPFLATESGGKLVAFRPDRRGFLDPDHPFLWALDGVPVEKWLEAAGEIVPRGSPQLARRLAARNLRFVGYLRRELGLEVRSTVSVELRGPDGRAVVKTLPVSSRYPIFGTWPRGEDRLLPGNIGYLRLAEMDDSPGSLERIRQTMSRFQETSGLVIDVRENGGGSREPLRTLFPCFLGEDAPAHVANVALYLPGPGDLPASGEGYLEDRFLFPITASVWSSAERESLKQFAAGFQPEWRPAGGGEWHYFLLGRPVDGSVPRYRRPAVILMDAGCFSATDIFLGAFKGTSNVTLLGTPSGGGSGRARRHELSRSGLGIRLSSMVSYRPDGRLYDGRGVEPDVLVEPIPTDLIGVTDSLLEAALARLRGGR